MVVVVQSPPIEFLSEFVNSWAEAVHHDPAPEGGRLCGSGETFVERFGVRLAASVSDGALAVIADTAYLVFAAPAKDRLDLANEFIAAAKLQPVLRNDSGLWWASGRDSTIGAQAAAALLLHARSDPALGRLGVCTAHRCRDAYADSSQGATRRFCSERCQTRA